MAVALLNGAQAVLGEDEAGPDFLKSEGFSPNKSFVFSLLDSAPELPHFCHVLLPQVLEGLPQRLELAARGAGFVQPGGGRGFDRRRRGRGFDPAAIALQRVRVRVASNHVEVLEVALV